VGWGRNQSLKPSVLRLLAVLVLLELVEVLAVDDDKSSVSFWSSWVMMELTPLSSLDVELVAPFAWPPLSDARTVFAESPVMPAADRAFSISVPLSLELEAFSSMFARTVFTWSDERPAALSFDCSATPWAWWRLEAEEDFMDEDETLKADMGGSGGLRGECDGWRQCSGGASHVVEEKPAGSLHGARRGTWYVAVPWNVDEPRFPLDEAGP
jgi:hypothetical protein